MGCADYIYAAAKMFRGADLCNECQNLRRETYELPERFQILLSAVSYFILHTSISVKSLILLTARKSAAISFSVISPTTVAGEGAFYLRQGTALPKLSVNQKN